MEFENQYPDHLTPGTTLDAYLYIETLRAYGIMFDDEYLWDNNYELWTDVRLLYIMYRVKTEMGFK